LHGSEDVSYIHALQQAGYTVIKAISCIPSNTTISMVRQRIEMYRSCIILLDVEKDHPHEKFSKSFLNVICRTREIMVAGGITTDDLPSLLAEPCPWGFDVARGIETDGVVDMQKISTLCALLHSYS
jgi:phosphoribosylanthranilate isomerase